MQSTIVVTILGLAAQIESEFISAWTKEALLQRRAQGMKLGGPKGFIVWPSLLNAHPRLFIIGSKEEKLPSNSTAPRF